MIQGDFQHIKAPEAVRFSRGHFDLVVESFHRAQSDPVSAAKPIEQMFLMNTQHLDDLFHRLEPREKSTGPGFQDDKIIEQLVIFEV